MQASPSTPDPARDRAALDARLLDLARASILDSLRAGRPAGLPAERWPPALAAPGASFVTLSRGDALRGCCGSVEARRALAEDVWVNAQRTAFADPRFPPLSEREVPGLTLEISLLGPLTPLAVDSEQALLAALRPGVDGLLMTLGERRATFLPKVWHTLPEPRDFLAHLKHKLGVPVTFWDPALRFHRYHTRQFAGALDADTPRARSTPAS